MLPDRGPPRKWRNRAKSEWNESWRINTAWYSYREDMGLQTQRGASHRPTALFSCMWRQKYVRQRLDQDQSKKPIILKYKPVIGGNSMIKLSGPRALSYKLYIWTSPGRSALVPITANPTLDPHCSTSFMGRLWVLWTMTGSVTLE